MNKKASRVLSLLTLIALCVSLLSTVCLQVSAADISYTYDGKYIYNWGERGEVATSLSPNAEDFYEKYDSYDELSALLGGTGKSDAPKSALYSALKSLMSNAQTYKTSYNATKSLFKYTDCQNSGGKISSFYSGNLIGPSFFDFHSDNLAVFNGTVNTVN